jgi:pimeloyl-ACP methyl ester carboxylesterase
MVISCDASRCVAASVAVTTAAGHDLNAYVAAALASLRGEQAALISRFVAADERLCAAVDAAAADVRAEEAARHTTRTDALTTRLEAAEAEQTTFEEDVANTQASVASAFAETEWMLVRHDCMAARIAADTDPSSASLLEGFSTAAMDRADRAITAARDVLVTTRGDLEDDFERFQGMLPDSNAPMASPSGTAVL